MAAVLYAMVGLPCAGKTDCAARIARKTGAVRLTPDEWHTRLFGHDMDSPEEHDARHGRVEALMRDVADSLLRCGVSVILDFGFWAVEERDYLREHARDLGAGFMICYMDTPMDEIYARLEARNASGRRDIFRITRADMEGYLKSWQPPTDAEENLLRITPEMLNTADGDCDAIKA